MNKYDELTKNFDQFKSGLANTLLSAGYITGIIVGVIGLVILIIQLNYFYKIRQINRWPVYKDAGTIRDSYLEIASGGTTYSIFVVSSSSYTLYYRTRVAFTYEVNGKKYVSRQLSYYESWNSNPMYAKIESDIYVRGRKVNIRINPKNPSEAYITNKPYNQYLLTLIGIILTAIGLYVIYKS